MSIGITSVQSIKAVNSWITIIDSNIEGAPRTAYKSSRVHITDGLAANRAPRKLGDLSGVQPTFTIQSTSFDTTQGQIHQTGAEHDKAIEGDGYMIFTDSREKTFFSRDGQMSATPGAHFNYVTNSSGLYLNDTAMAINFGAHKETDVNVATINDNYFNRTISWTNAQTRLDPAAAAANLDIKQPKPIWHPYAAVTDFEEGGAAPAEGYRYQTVMLRKSFQANTNTFNQNNDLVIRVPPQFGNAPNPALPEFFDNAGAAFATNVVNGTTQVTNATEGIQHATATQVFLNGQLVMSVPPDPTGVIQTITLTNAELAPFMQKGMNTLAIRATEWNDEEGIEVLGVMGGQDIVSDETWASRLVGTADVAGFVSSNTAYAAAQDRVNIYQGAGLGLLPGVLDSAANWATNYQQFDIVTNPVPAPDGDEGGAAGAPGDDPDGRFRLNLSGSRTVVNFGVFNNTGAGGAFDPSVDPAAAFAAGATWDTTIGNYVAGNNQTTIGVPVAIFDKQGNLVNNNNTANGIFHTINGSDSLEFYLPDFNPAQGAAADIAYTDGAGGDLKVALEFQEEINGVMTNYYEVYTIRRTAGGAYTLAHTPNAVNANFKSPHPLETQRALTVPDYDDLTLAQAPNQQGLRYSQYGATVFEVPDGTGVNTTGVMITGKPGEVRLKLDDTGAVAATGSVFGRIHKMALEQSNASLTEYIPTLALAQKVFSAISKILNVFISEVDDLNGLIR